MFVLPGPHYMKHVDSIVQREDRLPSPSTLKHGTVNLHVLGDGCSKAGLASSRSSSYTCPNAFARPPLM